MTPPAPEEPGPRPPPRHPRPPDGPSASSPAPPTCVCPNCGTAVAYNAASNEAGSDAAALLRQARQQIQDLQAQVARLDQKAASAIDRWADYEDELTGLRRQLSAARSKPASSTEATTTLPSSSNGGGGGGAGGAGSDASPTRPSFLPSGAANRLSALLSPRAARSTPNLKAAAATAADASSLPTPPPSAASPYGHALPPSPPRRTPDSASSFRGNKNNNNNNNEGTGQSTKDLMLALTREQALRRAAEGRLQDTSREVEELSVSLFEQANEMVAEERRARARLEARVATLEQRDTDKKRRLERLEQAMDRIARVRALLGEHLPPATARPLAASNRQGATAPAVAAA